MSATTTHLYTVQVTLTVEAMNESQAYRMISRLIERGNTIGAEHVDSEVVATESCDDTTETETGDPR